MSSSASSSKDKGKGRATDQEIIQIHIPSKYTPQEETEQQREYVRHLEEEAAKMAQAGQMGACNPLPTYDEAVEGQSAPQHIQEKARAQYQDERPEVQHQENVRPSARHANQGAHGSSSNRSRSRSNSNIQTEGSSAQDNPAQSGWRHRRNSQSEGSNAQSGSSGGHGFGPSTPRGRSHSSGSSTVRPEHRPQHRQAPSLNIRAQPANLDVPVESFKRWAQENQTNEQVIRYFILADIQMNDMPTNLVQFLWFISYVLNCEAFPEVMVCASVSVSHAALSVLGQSYEERSYIVHLSAPEGLLTYVNRARAGRIIRAAFAYSTGIQGPYGIVRFVPLFEDIFLMDEPVDAAEPVSAPEQDHPAGVATAQEGEGSTAPLHEEAVPGPSELEGQGEAPMRMDQDGAASGVDEREASGERLTRVSSRFVPPKDLDDEAPGNDKPLSDGEETPEKKRGWMKGDSFRNIRSRLLGKGKAKENISPLRRRASTASRRSTERRTSEEDFDSEPSRRRRENQSETANSADERPSNPPGYGDSDEGRRKTIIHPF